MADDDTLAQFTSITSADPQRAQQYLTLADGNLEAAIQLYFENDGADMGATVPEATSLPPAQPPASEPVQIDSDNESEGGIALNPSAQQPSTEDDEAIARRMQEEMYGGRGEPGEGGNLPGGGEVEDVRAPMARTSETLAAPGGMPPWRYDDGDELAAAVREQMLGRVMPGSSRESCFDRVELALKWMQMLTCEQRGLESLISVHRLRLRFGRILRIEMKMLNVRIWLLRPEVLLRTR